VVAIQKFKGENTIMNFLTTTYENLAADPVDLDEKTFGIQSF